jgi:hypothetical protein
MAALVVHLKRHDPIFRSTILYAAPGRRLRARGVEDVVDDDVRLGDAAAALVDQAAVGDISADDRMSRSDCRQLRRQTPDLTEEASRLLCLF